MGECYDLGIEVGGLASHLIDETPGRYVTIGSQWAEIGPDMHKFDDLVGKDFTTAYGDLGLAMNDVAVPGQGSGAVDIGVSITANDTFANMDRVASDMDNWDGRAATNFADNYKAQLPYVADHQFTVISVLGAALEAQEELYTKTRDNVVNILNTTLSGLEAIDARDQAIGALALTALAAAGTVAVTIVSGGTLAPLAITIAAVSGAASTGASATAIDFDTDDPRTVMDRFYEAIGRVEDHFRSRETEIRDGLTEVAAAVNSDLTRASWADGEYPAYRFKPTGFANGPSDLGGWTP